MFPKNKQGDDPNNGKKKKIPQSTTNKNHSSQSKENARKKKKEVKGNTRREGEGSLYDKIMRENLLQLFLPLVAEQLNFEFKTVHPLPDKQPTTILRETDAFLLVTTNSKTEPRFILHLEFESKNNEDMIYRMAEYHGIGLRKHKLPIKHVVVYLGKGKPSMRTSLPKKEVFEGFTLVNVHHFSPKKWLAEKEPAKIIMAVLGNYQKANAELILEAIVTKLRRVCKTESELKKFIEQLIIISRMRNLEQLTIKISKAMPITIDIEKDYLYNLGLKKAEELLNQAKAAALAAEAETAKLVKEKAKVAKEKAALEAKAIKATQEKAELEAKIAQEKATLEAKAAQEKATLEAKAAQEKAALEAKAAQEKAALEAKAAQEKAVLEAKAIKAEREAKAAQEKAALEAKAAQEKAEREAKVAQEKAALEAKVAQEKVEREAKAVQEKAKTEKKISIQKMKKSLSDEEIMEFLSLDKVTFNQYMIEINQEVK